MEMLFGKEFLHYENDKKRVCYVSCEDAPDYVYDHDHWEAELLNRLVETPCHPSSPSRRNATVNEPQDKEESKPARRCLFPSKKAVATPKLKKKSLKSLKSGQKSPSSSMTGQKLDPSSPHSPSSRNSTTNDAQGKEKPKPVRRSLFGVESTIATPNLKRKGIEPIKSVQKLDPQALTKCISQTATRQELSAIQLPPVSPPIQDEDIVPISGKFQPDDPFMMKSHPAERTMEVASKIVHSYQIKVLQGNTIQLDDDIDTSGVMIGNLGNFDSHGVKVLSSYCSVANMQREYNEEMSWLRSNPGNLCLGEADVTRLHEFFQTSPHNPKRVVTSLDGLNVDFKSISTLAKERYVDNFVINYCLKMILILTNAEWQKSTILCLPSEAFLWLANENLDPVKNIIMKEVRNPEHLKFVLMPLHFSIASHWGLICVDLEKLTVWFDDGMTVIPPSNLCWLMGRLVEQLGGLFPNVNSFDSKVSRELSASHIRRIGMPQQQGGGSCRMGVILLARDIIPGDMVPPQQIPWTFQESNYHRKQLMLFVIATAKEAYPLPAYL